MNIMAPREIIANITERGQVTIPVEVRKILGLKPRDQVAFTIENNEVRLRPLKFTWRTVYASVEPKHRPEDFEQMIRQAKEEKAAETVRKMRQN
jgi:antitoxin PrlF